MAKIFLISVILVYLAYTLHFAIQFNRSNYLFSRWQKVLHNILIWFIPFIWIVILKLLSKPMPGYHQYKSSRKKGMFYESWLGLWGDAPSDFGSDGADGGDSSGAGDGGGD
ncbi:MAG: hypothetical protein ACJ75J_09020 [Cytophagaceae bacterium]